MTEYPYYSKRIWLPDKIKNFRSFAKLQEYPEKTVLFSQGEASDRVYFIEEGTVSLYHLSDEGKAITVMIHNKGDIVGHACVLNSPVREVSCETVSTCRIWEFPRNDFLKMMENYPEVAIWAAYDLATRIRIIGNNVRRLVGLTAEQRLAAMLVELAINRDDFDGSPITLDITHQELSELVGITRQTTTKILGCFKNEGIISTRKGHVDIKNLNRLRGLMDQTDTTYKR